MLFPIRRRGKRTETVIYLNNQNGEPTLSVTPGSVSYFLGVGKGYPLGVVGNRPQESLLKPSNYTPGCAEPPRKLTKLRTLVFFSVGLENGIVTLGEEKVDLIVKHYPIPRLVLKRTEVYRYTNFAIRRCDQLPFIYF